MIIIVHNDVQLLAKDYLHDVSTSWNLVTPSSSIFTNCCKKITFYMTPLHLSNNISSNRLYLLNLQRHKNTKKTKDIYCELRFNWCQPHPKGKITSFSEVEASYFILPTIKAHCFFYILQIASINPPKNSIGKEQLFQPIIVTKLPFQHFLPKSIQTNNSGHGSKVRSSKNLNITQVLLHV